MHKLEYYPISAKYNLTKESITHTLPSELEVRNSYDWVPDLQIGLLDPHEELVKKLPEELRASVNYYAYDHGHSAGQEECDLIERELIEMLLPGLEKYKTRIITEYLNTSPVTEL